jgi:AcrR family transcriptional regulator
MAGDASAKTAPEVQSETKSKGERTRERILDLAYEAVLRKGVAATSIEELVEAAGITKSGFYHHYNDKTELARRMLERYTDTNTVFLDGMMARARELNEDPLHSFLIFLKLYAEAMEVMVEQHPGCMVATVSFQDLAWDRQSREMTAESVLAWRARLTAWLEEIAAVYPPKGAAPLEDLAEAILAFSYGGMTLGKALDDPRIISRQALMFRETVRVYFLGL